MLDGDNKAWHGPYPCKALGLPRQPASTKLRRVLPLFLAMRARSGAKLSGPIDTSLWQLATVAQRDLQPSKQDGCNKALHG